MINMLLALTEGTTSGNYETFIHSNYWCGLGLLQDLSICNRDLEEKDITFYDNRQELLLYTNLGIYACNYITYCDTKFITSVWNKDGLVLEYDFDYDSQTSSCLYDLWELARKCPGRWVYKLDSIYSKYGTDVVNLVRDNAKFNCVSDSPVKIVICSPNGGYRNDE